MRLRKQYLSERHLFEILNWIKIKLSFTCKRGFILLASEMWSCSWPRINQHNKHLSIQINTVLILSSWNQYIIINASTKSKRSSWSPATQKPITKSQDKKWSSIQNHTSLSLSPPIFGVFSVSKHYPSILQAINQHKKEEESSFEADPPRPIFYCFHPRSLPLLPCFFRLQKRTKLKTNEARSRDRAGREGEEEKYVSKVMLLTSHHFNLPSIQLHSRTVLRPPPNPCLFFMLEKEQKCSCCRSTIFFEPLF